MSGNPGVLHQQLAEAQDMLSLASGVGFAGQTMNAGLPYSGGVLGAPPQSFNQPRSIMTAGGGNRPQNVGARASYNSGGKRGQTS